MTHQPRVVFDYHSHVRMNLYWDANSNLSQMQNCEGQSSRFHDWDEENRLRMVIGKEYAGYYGYDANGERVYKLTGKSTLTYPSSYEVESTIHWNDIVLYPNPYVTITPKGYTKHYYANSERLATVIGKGGWCSMVQEPISPYQTGHDWYVDKWWYEQYTHNYPLEYPNERLPDYNMNETIGGVPMGEIQYDCPPRHLCSLFHSYDDKMLYLTMRDGCTAQDQEKFVYYTHSDHLGSASWITNELAEPVQYLHYLPYGQLLANQQAIGSTYDERYKFTGKERDYETGYDYFGARYYSSPFLHWISVDQLVDDYPQISPYSYCHWNPVKYVDPDGKRCSLSVNYRTNTITISAKYYASRNDSRYAMKAADFWNNQKGQTYTANDGKVYSVQYALSVYSSKNPEKDAGTDDNSFKVVNTLGTNVEGNKKTGETIANYKISVADAYKEESTGAHEIGHTLMNVPKGEGSEHAATGVMTKSISDDGRSWSVSQETVNNIVESNGFNQNPTLWQKIKSWFE